eukprot:8348784-Karenia_brevis.AAC.1
MSLTRPNASLPTLLKGLSLVTLNAHVDTNEQLRHHPLTQCCPEKQSGALVATKRTMDLVGRVLVGCPGLNVSVISQR